MKEYDADGNLMGKEKPSIWQELYETIRTESRMRKYLKAVGDYQEQKAREKQAEKEAARRRSKMRNSDVSPTFKTVTHGGEENTSINVS